MRLNLRYFLFLFFCFANFSDVAAQLVYPCVIKGKILDDDTGEPLPFASITIVGRTEGTQTDLDGLFEVLLNTPADSLRASMIGYRDNSKILPRDTATRVNFRLKSSATDLKEFTIRPDGIERKILQKIIKNKRFNTLQAFDSYECEEYAKVELDLHHIDAKMRNSVIMKPFEFVFKNVDTTSDEKPFLPAFMTETLANVYYTKGQPEVKKDFQARRVSGINNPTISEFISTMHADVNIYNNWITLVGKAFVSPFSGDALGYYNFYMLDSASIQGHKCYKLKFKPKRKQETTFYGDFWVADTSWAIANVNMRMSPDVNINFVNRIIIYQDFDFKDKHWYPTKLKNIIDFAPSEKTPGIIGRKSISYKNYVSNNPKTAEKYRTSDPEMVDPEKLKKDNSYWETVRHDSLTKSEKMVYKMVDSVKNVPIFKTYTEIITVFSTGFKAFGPIEIGNLYNMYNFNPVQGDRVKLSLSTSPKFSKDLDVTVFGAYGFKDRRARFGGKFQYNLQKYPKRTIIGGSYRDEVDFTTANSEESLPGSLLSGLIRRVNVPQKMVDIRESKAFIERWWTKGWSTKLTLLHYELDPYERTDPNGGGLNFSFRPNDEPAIDQVHDKIIASEAILKVRYAYGEKFIDGAFSRISTGTKYPKVYLQYAHSASGVINSQYSYDRLTLGLDHWFPTNPLGWTQYQVRAGKVFGAPLPYLLLEVIPGNETYMIEQNNFNTMNRFEFAADSYASLRVTQHFEGFFLNHVPLLRKLQLREVAYFRAIMGSMSTENQYANRNNYADAAATVKVRAPDKVPFMEAGVGIENIFKFFRVDCVWRLNYHDNPEAPLVVPMLGIDFHF